MRSPWMWFGAVAVLVFSGSCGSDDTDAGSSPAGTGGNSGGGAGGAAGAGGSAAGSGGAAGANTPVTLATGLPYPYRLAVDATHVYFVAVGTATSDFVGDGYYGRVSLAGGPVETFPASTPSAFIGLAIDANKAFLSVLDAGTHSGLVVSTPKSGGAETILVQDSSTDMTTDASGPSETATMLFYAVASTLKSVPADGGASATFFTGSSPFRGIAVDADAVYAAEFGDMQSSDPNAPPVGNGVLWAVPLGGGQASQLIANAGAANAVAVDDAYVYSTDALSGDIWKVGKDGTGATRLATGQHNPYKVVASDGDVYWTNRGAPSWSTDSCAGHGSLMMASRDGGAPTTLASALNCPVDVAIDGASVYWIEAGTQPQSSNADGTIKKLPR